MSFTYACILVNSGYGKMTTSTFLASEKEKLIHGGYEEEAISTNISNSASAVSLKAEASQTMINDT